MTLQENTSLEGTTAVTICCIEALCQQEMRYQKKSWMSPSSDASSTSRTAAIIDGTCRRTMITWFYQVVDSLRMSRNTVEIAVSYLDRFMSTPVKGRIASTDQGIFQLICIVCLYVAAKVHEPVVIDIQTMAKTISHGMFTVHQIERMERLLLSELNWRMNPPTSATFLASFMESMPELGSSLNDDIRKKIVESATMQTEWAIAHSGFVPVKASIIAYCAMMNALEGFLPPAMDKELGIIGYRLAMMIGLHGNSCNDSSLFNLQEQMFQNTMAGVLSDTQQHQQLVLPTKDSFRVCKSEEQRDDTNTPLLVSPCAVSHR